MCYYYQLLAKALEQDLENRFTKALPVDIAFSKKAFVNAFEHPKMPIIINSSNQIQFYNWGLIPNWAKDDSIKKYTLNARIESLSDKPSFRDSISKPCLIPSTGFYEWQWLDSNGKRKQKYLIQNSNESLFSFAGLYSSWVDQNTGEIRNTYTILTTKANSMMAEIHNTKKRMPVILKREDETPWLEGCDYHQFAYPYETELQAVLI